MLILQTITKTRVGASLSILTRDCLLYRDAKKSNSKHFFSKAHCASYAVECEICQTEESSIMQTSSSVGQRPLAHSLLLEEGFNDATDVW